MKIKFFLSLQLFFLAVVAALGQLTIRVTDIPNNTPAGDAIFVAGTFNNWDPGNSGYILENQGGEVYEITFSPSPGALMFKFTRGGWDTVEGNANGAYLPDRTYNYSGGTETLELQILSWEGFVTAPNYSVLSQDFFMPQLDRSRRIWLYLPPDYQNSGKNYPVLYMQDGQNVFDAATSAFGEWQVDEALNQLFDEGDEGVIVVAIDNGGSSRTDEYTPWANPNYGGGQGDAYVDFIVETLKPYIDQNYRTKPGREFTGIMGSSLGGLISFYAAIEHQDVFSKAGVFSASFWFADEVYTHVATTGKEADMRIYMIAGVQEGSPEDFGEQVADMNAMYNTLLSAGFSEEEVLAISHPEGQHSEWYWAREFPAAYQWLYQMSATGLEESNWEKPLFRAFPNPSDTNFQVITSAPLIHAEYEVLSIDGRLVQQRIPLNGKGIELEGLKAGLYFLRAYSDGKLVGVCKLVRQ
ncbi:MAG: T9SS type A sorting domain-containing protein [Lewinellaceae bacterium]|nr:T9SS type A sorting domain-containing protein [Phaeodactylibacter sp.]MCB9349142.1 T9SS type A sorting domain-containing protein [Lewinellaceae bacterium]